MRFCEWVIKKSQYLNENGVPASSHWTDETVNPNTSAVLTLSLTEMYCLSYLVCGVIVISVVFFLWGVTVIFEVDLVLEKPWCLNDACTKGIYYVLLTQEVFVWWSRDCQWVSSVQWSAVNWKGECYGGAAWWGVGVGDLDLNLCVLKFQKCR
jgi:hypothetical protein